MCLHLCATFRIFHISLFMNRRLGSCPEKLGARTDSSELLAEHVFALNLLFRLCFTSTIKPNLCFFFAVSD